MTELSKHQQMEYAHDFASHGVFVVGPGRSGTTYLAQVLSSSKDIFLVTEANWFRAGLQQGFRNAYRKQMEGWEQPATAPCRYPPILDNDGNWEDYYIRLAASYRYVGDKLALGPTRSGWNYEAIYSFLTRRFYDAKFLFVFRDPRAVIASARDVLGVKNPFDAADSFLSTMMLFEKLAGCFPHVRILYHEKIDSETFTSISEFLDVDLSTSASMHIQTRVRTRETSEFPKEIQWVDELYQEMQTLFPHGRSLQAEYHPAHPTRISQATAHWHRLRATTDAFRTR